MLGGGNGGGMPSRGGGSGTGGNQFLDQMDEETVQNALQALTDLIDLFGEGLTI